MFHKLQHTEISENYDYISTQLDVEILFQIWSPGQKDGNINEKRVTRIEDKINKNEAIHPIIIQGIDVSSSKTNIYLRTLDGRHRIIAARNKNLKEISALIPKEIYAILPELFSNLLKTKENTIARLPTNHAHW